MWTSSVCSRTSASEDVGLLVRRHRSDQRHRFIVWAVSEERAAPVELRLLEHADRELERERGEGPACRARIEAVQRFRDVHWVRPSEVVGRLQPAQLLEQFGLGGNFSARHGSSNVVAADVHPCAGKRRRAYYGLRHDGEADRGSP